MNIKEFLYRSGIRADQFLSASKTLSRSTGKAEIVFFPGCSLSGYNPDYVFDVRDYLTKHEGSCGIITACCAKPLKLMGDDETFRKRIEEVNSALDEMEATTVITACQNCYNVLRDYGRGRNILSLWPVMMKHGLPETLRGKYSGLDVCVQDSCTSTPEIMSSVREILRCLGVNAREFPGTNPKCCGGIQAITSGNPSTGREVAMKRAAESPCEVILSYCASCCSFMSNGENHKSIHILDLIFGNGEISSAKSNLVNRFITAKRLKEE